MGTHYVTGERIKQKRLEKKWSMEKLAEKVGLNRTTIGRTKYLSQVLKNQHFFNANATKMPQLS